MQLVLDSIWSPDLTPPSEGVPADRREFSLLMQVALSERNNPGREVFHFTVCSPSVLAALDDGRFVAHTLVLHEFDWAALRRRVSKLLRHAESASSWGEVVEALAGYLRHADAG